MFYSAYLLDVENDLLHVSLVIYTECGSAAWSRHKILTRQEHVYAFRITFFAANCNFAEVLD